jgi:hypothetical protein
MNKDIYAYIHPLFLQVAHFKSVPVITKSSSSTEDELKECKLIIHKYGSKLEQASSFIDSLGILFIFTIYIYIYIYIYKFVFMVLLSVFLLFM